MNSEKDRDRRQTERAANHHRQERLKQALRENLKRRKSKVRGRDHFTDSPPNSDDVAGEAAGEKDPDK